VGAGSAKYSNQESPFMENLFTKFSLSIFSKHVILNSGYVNRHEKIHSFSREK
jgi:hypothetical protein